MVEFSFKYNFVDRDILQAFTQPLRKVQFIPTWPISGLQSPTHPQPRSFPV